MRKLIKFIILCCITTYHAQQVEIQTLLKDDISIRAIEVWDGKVWYAGTDSKFGYVNIDHPALHKQITLEPEKLQFRTLAQNRDYFFTVNIESPAYFFRINKSNLKVELIAKEKAPHVFYDALHFIDDNTAYAFSDPNKACGHLAKIQQLETRSAITMDTCFIKLSEGEAAFAASNTNIASTKKYVWIATGGKVSRILRKNKRTNKWQAFETPFVQGSSSQGIYSVDFYNNRFGIAVGGDYAQQEANINNIATTRDGGKTWQIQASGNNGGYKTCVKIRPGSDGREIVAVGDQNIEYSQDYGKTWKKISEEKNLYTCEWLDARTIILAGKNRIIKITLSN